MRAGLGYDAMQNGGKQPSRLVIFSAIVHGDVDYASRTTTGSESTLTIEATINIKISPQPQNSIRTGMGNSSAAGTSGRKRMETKTENL